MTAPQLLFYATLIIDGLLALVVAWICILAFVRSVMVTREYVYVQRQTFQEFLDGYDRRFRRSWSVGGLERLELYI